MYDNIGNAQHLFMVMMVGLPATVFLILCGQCLRGSKHNKQAQTDVQGQRLLTTEPTASIVTGSPPSIKHSQTNETVNYVNEGKELKVPLFEEHVQHNKKDEENEEFPNGPSSQSGPTSHSEPNLDTSKNEPLEVVVVADDFSKQSLPSVVLEQKSIQKSHYSRSQDLKDSLLEEGCQVQMENESKSSPGASLMLDDQLRFIDDSDSQADTKDNDRINGSDSRADTKDNDRINGSDSRTDTKDNDRINGSDSRTDTKDNDRINGSDSRADTKDSDRINGSDSRADTKDNNRINGSDSRTDTKDSDRINEVIIESLVQVDQNPLREAKIDGADDQRISSENESKTINKDQTDGIDDGTTQKQVWTRKSHLTGTQSLTTSLETDRGTIEQMDQKYQSTPVIPLRCDGDHNETRQKTVDDNLSEADIPVSTRFTEVMSLNVMDKNSNSGSIEQLDKQEDLDVQGAFDEEPRSLEIGLGKDDQGAVNGDDTVKVIEDTNKKRFDEIKEKEREKREEIRRSLTDPKRKSPDLEKSQMVPFEEQGTLKFPSETNRGHVEHLTAQVHNTFEIREMDVLHTEETIAAPKDEDSWIQLTPEYSKKLNDEFKALMKEMGNNIPSYIQSMFKSARWYKIYINIDAGTLDASRRFINYQCKSFKNSSLIDFVEQTSRPEFLDETVNVKRFTGTTEWSTKIEVEQENMMTGKRYIKWGTMSGIMRSRVNGSYQYYVMTAKHIFTGNVHNIWLKVKKDDSSHDDSCIELKDRNYVGVYGYVNINDKMEVNKVVDVALIPVDFQVVNQLLHRLKSRKAYARSKPLKMKVFTGPDKDLKNMQIQKEGVTTGLTRGVVSLVESAAFNDEGHMNDGIFIQAYRDPRIRPFAERGDSGAIVRIHDDDVKQNGECLALGMVHKCQNLVKYDGQEYANMSFMVRLDNCLAALYKEYKLDLEFMSEDSLTNPLEMIEEDDGVANGADGVANGADGWKRARSNTEKQSAEEMAAVKSVQTRGGDHTALCSYTFNK